MKILGLTFEYWRLWYKREYWRGVKFHPKLKNDLQVAVWYFITLESACGYHLWCPIRPNLPLTSFGVDSLSITSREGEYHCCMQVNWSSLYTNCFEGYYEISPPMNSLVSDMRSSYIMYHTEFHPPVTSLVNYMMSCHLMCHSKILPPVTSLVSDMRSSYMMFHTQLQQPVTSMVSDMRSSHMIFIHNFNLQWPQWWVIWGHPSWCIIHNIFLQWPHWCVIWGHPTSCFIQYFDLQWPHWWVTWGHPNLCIIEHCAFVISVTHHVSYNWAHRRSNFRVTSHGTCFLVPPVRSLES
jgi:hypothetical protein